MCSTRSRAAGTKAVAVAGDISQRATADETGRLRRGPRRAGHRRQQRRHHPRPDAVQHDRRGLGRRHRRAPARPFPADPQRRDLLAQQGQGCRGIGVRPHHQHLVGGRAVRPGRAGQLRRGQGRHHRADADRCAGPGSLRRSCQRHLPAGAHRDDRRRLRRGPRARRRARSTRCRPNMSSRLVRFLASPASDEVNGQVFIVYGPTVTLVAAPTAEHRFHADGDAWDPADAERVDGRLLC